ncbi:MAG: hypothetical protein ACFFED_02360 [Candidatus Thorarchaeota archaeon]
MPRDPNEFENSDGAIPHDPSPSVLAAVPDVLKEKLRVAILNSEKNKTSTLISSNTLANQFIFERWGIRSSQRRRYRNLFSQVRRQCRDVFRHYLQRGWLEVREDSEKHTFGVYEFDDKRGNLILGFVKVTRESEWFVKPAGG